MSDYDDLVAYSRNEKFLQNIIDTIEGDGLSYDDLVAYSRQERWLAKIIESIGDIGTPSQEDITEAVYAYLDEHGMSDLFIASADIQEVLQG